ncbi:AfsR/SARP family transcriptional regulator [Streptomyces benahoarensis]|uniref:AfsR family transcriptional regulator n=1 Tax=Streptomyces benahoarensis TaxID=2595054 RepID=A0A553ZEK2_9ACTN|nr:BTAD domain-containing putative transcriptional regulator [Streptomyces benahoarensis]TSB24918.1 AfsR family transcriptional regulator [Streptomyces benahoarensis]TSB39881.1 AfsR family transcriptional regulator [Streptomyces benahoarensis]
MEFRLLGAVSVVTEVGELPLGPAKRRSLLAALLLRPNHPVPVEALTDALWDQMPPPRARSVIQGHVSRLRSLLTEAGAGMYGVELVTQGAAYVLRMPESLLDAHRFEELVALARGQRVVGDAVAMYQEALALWQGPALTGAYRSAPLQAAAQALEELRLTAVELLAGAYTQVGEYARAASLLRAEAAAQPLRESLSAALIRTLQRAGRRSEALDWFHRTRQLLAEELGVGPGRELADAYAVVLRGDGDPAAPVAATAPAPPDPQAAPAPAHPGTADLLPRMPRGFHGRADELTALSRAAAGEAPVCLVTGPAGVGKTALVVHWAHRNRDRFPGGLLYADLRGFSDTREVEPAEVMRDFLLALGVAPRRIPESASGASALFRSLAADRQLLVVLDNAPGSAQVQELLPGGARCVTVVTSRHRLPALIASDAARPVPVDVLGPEDSAALLAAVLGEERVRAEAGAARRLAELCGGLPLALRVAAARLTDQPEWSLSTLSGELSDESRRLALLDVEDTGVRAALRLTVRRLPADAAHHFAHLGRHPGTHVDRYAAAALAATDPATAEAALDRLAAAHLVTRTAPDRWTLHDLVRLYARGLDADPDTLPRALDHAVATALAAADAAEPGDESCFPLPADFRAPPEIRRFAARDEAMAWYEAERDGLTLAAAAADAAGLHSRTWRLVLGLWPQIVWRVRDGWTPLLGTALEAARADGDLRAQSRILALLGWVLTEEGRVPEALAHLEAAPVLAARAGDRSAQATALINLSLAQAALGSPQEAVEECADAALLAHDAGDPYTERLALYHLTCHQLACGAWESALETVAAAQALDDLADASAAGRVLLVAAAGEALLGMGDEAAGTARLREAAGAAEACGFDDGAVRALGALLRVTTGAELATLQRRHDKALARLQLRS